MKIVLLQDNHFSTEDLEKDIRAWVNYYNNERYHESLDNLTPADIYFGRAEQRLRERADIKRKTMEERRRIYQQQKEASWTKNLQLIIRQLVHFGLKTYSPDVSDLNHVELFGRRINEKLLSVSSVNHISDINIPGKYPYEGVSKLWDVDFIEVSEECTQCRICNEGCPTGAIDSKNSALIDTVKCTLCCACIMHCPQNARTMKPSLMKDAAIRVHELFRERKEPEFFFNL